MFLSPTLSLPELHLVSQVGTYAKPHRREHEVSKPSFLKELIPDPISVLHSRGARCHKGGESRSNARGNELLEQYTKYGIGLSVSYPVAPRNRYALCCMSLRAPAQRVNVYRAGP